jgi:hypothetical protein
VQPAFSGPGGGEETPIADPSRLCDILFRLGRPRLGVSNWANYRKHGLSEDDVDELISLATDPSLHRAPEDSNEVWVPLHAWRALSQLGDRRAIVPLIGLFEPLRDDDWAFEELPRVVGMLGAEATEPLRTFLNAPGRDEYVLASAVGALEEIAKHDPSTRDTVVEIITNFLDHTDFDADFINGSAVSALIGLEARESIETIRRLYAADAVDLFACGDIEDVEMELGLRSQRSSPRPDLRKRYGFDQPLIQAKKKIGRNDPCPCGSGKKYKKCCL